MAAVEVEQLEMLKKIAADINAMRIGAATGKTTFGSGATTTQSLFQLMTGTDRALFTGLQVVLRSVVDVAKQFNKVLELIAPKFSFNNIKEFSKGFLEGAAKEALGIKNVVKSGTTAATGAEAAGGAEAAVGGVGEAIAASGPLAPVTAGIAAVAALAAALVLLPPYIKDFANALIDTRKEFEMSGAMAQVLAQHDLQNMIRDIDMGNRLAASTKSLDDRYQHLANSTQNLRELWEKMKNGLGEALVAVGQALADMIEPIVTIIKLTTEWASAIGAHVDKETGAKPGTAEEMAKGFAKGAALSLLVPGYLGFKIGKGLADLVRNTDEIKKNTDPDKGQTIISGWLNKAWVSAHPHARPGR